jgi:hypothetical protein
MLDRMLLKRDLLLTRDGLDRCGLFDRDGWRLAERLAGIVDIMAS